MLRNYPAFETASISRPIEARSFRGLVALAETWLERRRSRRALAALDARLLCDIGLTPSDAIAESAMPFWKPFVRLRKT